jgi:lipopolysaccharide export system protein LptA
MRAASLFLTLWVAGFFLNASAQVPQGTSLGRPSMALYRTAPDGGKILDCVVTGSSFTNLDAQIALVPDFELKSFKNGDAQQLQLTAQAPECDVNISAGVLSDAGPLQIFTPTTNLFVQGVGFYFVQSNHFLSLSNQVETRVLKALIKSSALSPRSNAPAGPPQFVTISAHEGQFSLESNVVDYAGHVHLVDPQLDMTCELLTIRLTSNFSVESMLARHNVVLTTTNNGHATGEWGLYYLTNGDEMMRLTTNAIWHNGDEEADAQEFDYDSNKHFLTGTKVKALWPNPVATPPGQAHPTVPVVGTNGFRVLYADYATLQFPPTNGPVERMTARGNVLVINQADHTSAIGEQGVYDRATDSVELTGHPVWWTTNKDMEVKADVLSGDLGHGTYHARKNAHLKMRTGTGTGNGPAGPGGHSTNQWLYVSSDEMEDQTNQATFSRNVEARLLDNGKLRNTLTSDFLTLNLISNHVDSAFASHHVHGWTAPDASGVVKTITCEQLNAFTSAKTGQVERIDAHTNVVIVEKGTGRGASTNTLTADDVTAHFLPLTNQIDRAVAEGHVVFNQLKDGHVTHATSRHGVYLGGTNDEVKLTGTPLAHNDFYIITNSEFLLWKRAANLMEASGRYQIIPLNPPVAKNVSSP